VNATFAVVGERREGQPGSREVVLVPHRNLQGEAMRVILVVVIVVGLEGVGMKMG